MIKIITPKDAVIYDDRIKKCTTKPSAKELAAISHVSLLAYEKPVVPGYSKIQVQNLHDDQVLIEKKFNAVDLLWLYGKWKNLSPLPGWNGYLQQLTKNNQNFSTSQVIFLPFIDHPASNLDTIYTTLHSAINIAKSHQQKTCIITFDQPLYSKAREMVAASDANSDLSKTVVKLGGFHMLMSFLGCIGHVMDGSGLKEALSKIYATNSVDKMLNGHAYARSIRGHILLRLALSIKIFEEMKIENCVLDELIEQITSRDVSYEDVEGCTSSSNSFIDQFQDKLKELKARGPTAQLWVQYFEMRITVSKKFESNLQEYLQYELSPYPTSLFDSNGMRKTTKATLYDNMMPVVIDLDENNVTYIIDGGFLLHRVVWSKDDTFSIILNKYIKYLQTHYGSAIVVVFDGYSDYSKNIKALEQQRRTAALSKSYEVCFDETMVVPISQEFFLSNRSNKKKFIDMLVEKFKTVNITTKQARDDADVLIIDTAIALSEHQKTAVIIGEDIDLLVILIGHDGIPKIKRKKSSHINLPTLSKTYDRYGVSDRAAAAIASSVLHDIGSDLEVIDRHKLRRGRSKNRQKLVKEVINTELSALYFDGKEDKTLKIVKKGFSISKSLPLKNITNTICNLENVETDHQSTSKANNDKTSTKQPVLDGFPSTSKFNSESMELVQSTSKASIEKVENKSTDSPVLKGAKNLPLSERYSNEASWLQKKLHKLQLSKNSMATRLKKALKLSENATFQKAVSKFTAAGLLFMMMQFRESKKLKMGGEEKTAKWEHVFQLYKEDPAYQGIRLMPKLTDKHVVPEKIAKMKVKCASQLFSQSVSVNMGYLASKGIISKDCKETADLFLFLDNLFDSLNGSHKNSKKRSGKPLLGPVTPSSGHHKIWREAKEVLKTMKFVTSNGYTVVPSITNWLQSIENIEYLVQKIFTQYDLASLWMRHFNQDPLENFFGSIRSHGQQRDEDLSDVEDHVELQETIPTDSDIDDDDQPIGIRQMQRRSGIILSSDSENEETSGTSFHSTPSRRIIISSTHNLRGKNADLIRNILTHTNEEIELRSSKYKESRYCYYYSDMRRRTHCFAWIAFTISCKKDNHLTSLELFDPTFSGSRYISVMSRERFDFLLNCLRFDDKSTRNERKAQDKFAPIRDLWGVFIQICRDSYKAGSYITIDEQLLSFRGRCKFRIKPNKYGLKILMLCDAKTNYMLNARPYLGQTETNGDSLGSFYVKTLTEGLWGRNRNITMDNWFTSVPLAQRIDYKSLEEAVNSIEENSKDVLEYDLAIIQPEPSVVTDEEEVFDDDNVLRNLQNDVPGNIEVFVRDKGVLSDSSDDEPLATKRARIRSTVPQAADDLSTSPSSSTSNTPVWRKCNPNYTKTYIESDNRILNESRMKEAVKDLTPVQIFELFFDDEVFDMMVNFSNLYPSQNNRHKSYVSAGELKVFIGILILSGYHKLPGEPRRQMDEAIEFMKDKKDDEYEMFGRLLATKENVTRDLAAFKRKGLKSQMTKIIFN
ncbi:unnamed protein product [Arctia plantaginis]|uniref:Uncharacterized protein n=1 Tax=Arctia plantaginis TaxID=874455 RepID=A0A8S0ZHM3_ARCPL|nr:unnamed protein product [Arctia plantaginis]